jgi:eukaryotic-like serine/threonine-protein kinase
MAIQPLPIPLPTNATINFDLKGLIGQGGEAEVFLAYDTQLNAEIAIKRIPVTAFTDMALYFAESQKLYLTRHHNVVDILYGGQDPDYIYLAMPYYSKGSIKALIDSRALSSREIIRYSLQFLSGLNNVHSKRLIHFDIKCENVLLSNKNQALLSDFGLAEYTKHYGFSALSGTTQVYAPLEFFSQTEHNLAFDIYQAGLTMYRMCVGDDVFETELVAYHDAKGDIMTPQFVTALSKKTFPSRDYPPHIPIALKKIVNRALEPDPANRYSSVIGMLNDLSDIDVAHDWIYSKNAQGIERWELNDRFIEARLDTKGWEILAKKNSRRVTDFCQKELSDSKKKGLIYKGLMDGL